MKRRKPAARKPRPTSRRDAGAAAGDERVWKPPKRSDQPPGEHVVQVNDAYVGGQKEVVEPVREQQHPHGG